eukprot:6591814-Pyramimonas_sp.AAC.1
MELQTVPGHRLLVYANDMLRLGEQKTQRWQRPRPRRRQRGSPPSIERRRRHRRQGQGVGPGA